MIMTARGYYCLCYDFCRSFSYFEYDLLVVLRCLGGL